MLVKNSLFWELYALTKKTHFSRVDTNHDFQFCHSTFNEWRNESSFTGFISIYLPTFFTRNTLCDRSDHRFQKIIVRMFLYQNLLFIDSLR
jgi:hypothetical protein